MIILATIKGFVSWIFTLITGRELSKTILSVVSYAVLAVIILFVFLIFAIWLKSCGNDNPKPDDKSLTNSMQHLGNADNEAAGRVGSDEIIQAEKDLQEIRERESNSARDEANRAIQNANTIRYGNTKPVNGSDLDKKAREYSR